MPAKAALLSIRYAIQPCLFGLCLLACTDKGIFALDLRDTPEEIELALRRLQHKWKKASWKEDNKTIPPLIEKIFHDGQPVIKDLKFDLHGTEFQKKVWQALLSMTPGENIAYSDIAREICHPGAARAVGTAVKHHPIAFLVPCHRVRHKDGTAGGDETHIHRKIAILREEGLDLEYQSSSKC